MLNNSEAIDETPRLRCDASTNDKSHRRKRMKRETIKIPKK